MTQKLTAVYEDGVLKPATPLSLSNGERVEVIILGHPRPEPIASDPDDYDILEALNANRLAEGARPLLPQSSDDLSYEEGCKALDEHRESDRKLFPPELKGVAW